MKHLYHLITVFILFSFFSKPADASHIVGGDFYYRFISKNVAAGTIRYQVFLKLYRDCGTGASAYANTYSLTSWRQNPSTGAWATYGNYTMNPLGTAVSVVPSCIPANTVCIEERTYVTDVYLPIDTNNYYLGVGMCCRNGSINNITNPGNAGQSFYAYINKNDKYQNANPTYLNKPLPFLCNGRSQTFNQNASDSDGDSLVFALATPYRTTGATSQTPCNPLPGGCLVNWAATYSLANPLGSTSTISINSVTGEITATPNTNGNFVIAVTVKEYRKVNGVWILLGETRRDLQIIVRNCSTNLPPYLASVTPITPNSNNTVNQTVTAGDSICFKITFADSTGDSLKMEKTGPIFDATGTIIAPYAVLPDTIGDSVVSSTFCWTTECPHARPGSPYIFTVNVEDNFCNSLQKTFTVTVNPKPELNPPTIRCVDIESDSSIKITFSKPPALPDFAKYYVYRRTGVAGTFALRDSINDSTITVWRDTLITNAKSQSYAYYIRTGSTCNIKGQASDSINTIIVSAVKPSANCTRLSWTAQSVNASPIYQIKRNGVVIDTSIFNNKLICDCNSSGTYQISVPDATASCTSNSNITASFNNRDTVAPKPISIVRATVDSWSAIRVVWPKSDSNDVARYIIYRSVNGGSYNPFDSVANNNGATYTWVDASNINTARYCYRIAARDTCGNLSLQSAEHCPVNLSSTAGNLRSNLAWPPLYSGFGLANQQVQRLIGGNWVTISTRGPADSNFVDSNSMGCNNTYYYRIKSVSASDTNIVSYSDTTFTIVYDSIIPATPNLRYVTVSSNTSVDVVFNTISDPDVNRYQIFFSVNGGSFSSAGFVFYPSGNPTTFTHTGLNTLSNTYSYYVVAIDSCSNNTSTASNTHTTVQVLSNAGNRTSILNWSKYVGFSVNQYKIQRLIGGIWTTIKTNTATDTSYNDTTQIFGCTLYSYRIIASNIANSDTSVSDTTMVLPFDTVKPATPILRSVSVISNTTVQITFERVADLDVNRYQIYGNINGGGYSLITTLFYPGPGTLITFNHSGLNTLANLYSYYVIAIDSCGNNISNAPPAHTTIQLSGNAGAMRNFLNWTSYGGWVPNQYVVQRLIGGVWTNIKILASTDTAWSDTTALACNQPFSYRVFGVRSGNADTSFSDSTIVIPYDTIRPATPLLRRVSVTSNTSIDVVFEKVADADVNRYAIYSSTNGGSFSLLATLNYPLGNPVIYSHSGINTLSNRYSYYVIAIDSCSNNLSDSSGIHTSVQLSGTAANLTSQLSWTAYAGWPVNEYRLQRLIGGVWTFIKSLPGNTTNFDDTTGLACNFPYSYRVVAINNSGTDSSYSDSTQVIPWDTISPNSPTIRNVTVSTNSSVSIFWTGGGSPDVNAYIIYRNIGSGFVAIDTVYYSTTYTDINVDPHTAPVEYCIKAMDSCANNKSNFSDIHRTIKLDLNYQFCPNGIILNWNPYLFWTAGINSYEIYRTDNFGTETLITSVAGNINSYTDTTILYSQNNYCYRVNAIPVSGIGFSSFSDSTCLTTPLREGPEIEYVSKLSTSTTTGSVEIKWNASAQNNYVKYSRLYYSSTGLPGSYSILYDNIPLSINSYLHNGLNTQTANHWYYMVSVDSCNRQSDSISIHKTMNFALIGGQLINLMNWTRYEGWPVYKYVLERKAVSQTNFVFLDSIAATDTFYTDFPAPCNIDLYYRITAISFDGLMSWSDTAGTKAIDTIPADKPRFMNATVLNNNVIRLDYTSADSLDIYGYTIYRSVNGGPFTTLKFVQFGIPNQALTHFDTTNTLQNQYKYFIMTLDSCLNATPSDTFWLMQLTGMAGSRQNFLRWHPFKEYPLSNYTVQKYIAGVWTNYAIINPTDTFFDDLNQPCYILQQYRIVANENSGTPRTSLSDTLNLIPFDTTRPAEVKINFATVSSNSSITLNWNLSDSDVLLYEIQSKTSGGNWGVVTTVNNLVTNYVHNGLNTLDSTYCYRIIAIDSCAGNRSDSSLQHCVMQLTGTALNTSNQLQWTPYIGFGTVSKYFIQTFNGTNWSDIDSVAGNINSYLHTPLACNVPIAYRILVYDSFQIFNSLSDTLILIPYDTLKPAIPIIRKVTTSGPNSIEISFEQVADPDVNRYEIYSSVNGAAFTLLTTLFNPSTNPVIFNHTGISPQINRYCYYIVAIDSCSNNRSIESAPHCNVELQATAGNMMSNLIWRSYVGFSTKNYNIQRLNGGVWTTIGTISNNDTSYVDSALIICNTNYFYRIETQEIGGNGEISISDTVMVTPFDTVKPLPPAIQFSTVLSNTSTRVVWNSSPSKDVKFYELWRIDPGGSQANIATIIYDTTYDDLSVITQSNVYCYYIIAIDSCTPINRSIPSNISCTINLDVKTVECVPTAKLAWNASTAFDAMPVAKYEVLRSTNGGSIILHKTLPGTDTSWTDSSVTIGNDYCYWVRAFDQNLNYVSVSDTQCVSPLVYPIQKAPEMLVATVIQSGIINGSILLSWNKEMDTLARGYRIYHSSTGLPGSFSLLTDITNIDTIQYLHTGTNTATALNYYRMVTYDLCNYDGDTAAVHQAINLSITNANLESQLSWNKYKGWMVTGYTILRSTDGVNFSPLNIVDSSTTTYSDTLVSCDIKYFYQIRANELAGNNQLSFSNIDSVISFDTIPPVAIAMVRATVLETSNTTGIIQLDFNANSDRNRNGYNIYRSINAGPFNLVKWLQVTSTGFITYADSTLNTKSNIHSYYITVTDSCGNESVISDTHTVMNLSALATNGINQLTWTPYLGFANWNYIVERSTSLLPAWTTVANLTSGQNNWNDNDVLCDVRYYYRITAVNQNNLVIISFSDTSGVVGFESVAPIVPELKRVTVTQSGKTNGMIQLDWNHSTSPDATYYLIYRRSDVTAAWQFIKKTGYINTTVDSFLNTTDSIYYYYIEAEDNCRNISVPSSNHGSINLQATAGNNRVILNWNNYQGWAVDKFEIYKDGSLLNTIPGTDFSYVDSQLFCGIPHSYRIKAFELNGNLEVSESDTANEIPFDTIAPAPTYIKTVTVEIPNKQVRIDWAKAKEFDADYYLLYRMTDGKGSHQLIYKSTSPNDTTFADTSGIAADGHFYCYYMKTADNCSNISVAGNNSCTILAKGKEGRLYNDLSWTRYNYWNGGVAKYNIMRSDDGGIPLMVGSVDSSTFTFRDTLLAIDVRQFCYFIQAEEGQGSYDETSESNTLCLAQQPVYWIPNAFTPSNKDLINDVFEPLGTYIDHYQLLVFDRWGGLLFESTPAKPAWDGKDSGGNFVPLGTYIYRVTIYSYDGNETNTKGTITVLE